MNSSKYKNLIEESINQIDQFELAVKRIRHVVNEQEANNLIDSISSFILELLQESKLINDDEQKSCLLKILAIKAVCLIDWNLNELEKEIPFVELKELMEYLIYLTNLHQVEKTKNYKLKKLTNLDLIKLDKEQIFILQFYLRWNLRLKLSSKNHYCAKTKSKKLSLTSTKETIDYLELFLKYLTSNDLYKPVSTCFSINKNINNFELNWNNMVKYDKDEIRNIINYDLGMYFFQQEEYEEAFYYFHSVKDYKNKILNQETKLNELNSYANELESYIIACKSMLNIDIENDSCTTTIISNNSHSISFNDDDLNTKQVITKMVLIENCIKNNLKNVFTKIPEESFLVLVQNMNHKNIDKDLKKKFQQFMELIMEAKGKDFDVDDDHDHEEDVEHRFDDDEDFNENDDDDDEDEDDDDDENYDDEDDEDAGFYIGNEENFQHGSCCPNHAISKISKKETMRIDFNQVEQTEQAHKTSAQRKKEKRKLRKKLKKLQKEEENMDRLSTTASTTSTNTTATMSTINVNDILNEKSKDLKLIRKKMNKEAREQAEKELEKQLQKIVNTSKKSTQTQPQTQSQPQNTKSQKSNKKKNKSKGKKKNIHNQPTSLNKKNDVQELEQEETSEKNEEDINSKSKTVGDLDDFSEPDNAKKLNDLDDFNDPLVPVSNTLGSLDDFSLQISAKVDKLNVLDDFEEFTKIYSHSQKLVIPDENFHRVVGSKNSNLNLIEKITNAKLNLDNHTVLIYGDSIEIVEFALELIHTLINDPQADLLHLLPVEPAKPIETKPVKNENRQKNIQKSHSKPTTSQSAPTVQQKFNNQTVVITKPRNFAEAVAKKPIVTKLSHSQMINNINHTASNTQSTLAISNNNSNNKNSINNINNIIRPVSVVPPLKNDKIEDKFENLKIELANTQHPGAPPSTPQFISQSLGSLSSSTSSSASTSSEPKQENLFDSLGQLWSLNDNDLLDRLSPFLSTSTTATTMAATNNVDKINTTNTNHNIAISKPIGYERNGKLQQANFNTIENKQYAFINPIVNHANQIKKVEIAQKPVYNNFSASLPANQWLNYSNFYQQDTFGSFVNQNNVYHNYGFNNYQINNGFGIPQSMPGQPNIMIQPTVGSIFPQQQYRY